MKIILSIVLLFLTIQLNAQNSLNLMDAINRSLEYNYDIKLQRLSEEQSKINNTWGTAGRYPTISLSGVAGDAQNFNSSDNYNQLSLNAGVSLNWVLFNGMAVNITKQKLAELEDFTQGYSTILIEGTIQSVILAYYTILLEQEKLKVYSEIASLSADRLEYETLKNKLGTTVSYELLQFKNAYLSDQSSVVLQKANLNASIRDLEYLMGSSKSNFQFSQPFNVEVEQYDFEELKTKMLSDNSTIKNQYINVRLLERDIELAQSKFLPTVSLNAGSQLVETNTNYQSAATINSNYSNTYGNLTLSYTIFSGGTKKRALQIAKIEKEAGDIEIEDSKLILQNQLNDLFDYYEARKSIYDLSKEQLELAKIYLEISGEKLKAGTINSFNYRDVQLSYQNTALNHLNAIYNLLDANVSLTRITGGILSEYVEN